MGRARARQLAEIAHEFFHAWNLVALRPAGWGKLSYVSPAPTTGLWWSEGVTIYYASLLPRRVGFPEAGRTRTQQLESDIGEYFSNPGNTRVSPERASLEADAAPEARGDFSADYYLVGRLIGDALELIIADSTRDAHGLDGVMRSLYQAHANPGGFQPRDIERTADGTCRCNLSAFFRQHVRAAKPLDFGSYLRTLGLTVSLDTVPALDDAGSPVPDTRIWANPPRTGDGMRLILFNPNSIWSNAGLHTGMRVKSFNGIAIDSIPDMRRAVRSLRLNAIVPVEVIQNGAARRIEVAVTGYSKVRATIREIPGATGWQIARRQRWLAGRLARDEQGQRAPE